MGGAIKALFGLILGVFDMFFCEVIIVSLAVCFGGFFLNTAKYVTVQITVTPVIMAV